MRSYLWFLRRSLDYSQSLQECRHPGPGHERSTQGQRVGPWARQWPGTAFGVQDPILPHVGSYPVWEPRNECLCFSQVALSHGPLSLRLPPEAVGNPPGCESLCKSQLRRSRQVQDAITLFRPGKCDLTEGSPNHESGVQLLPVTHLSGSWMTESQSHTSSPESPRGDYRLTAKGFGLWLPTPTPESQSGMLLCSGVG